MFPGLRETLPPVGRLMPASASAVFSDKTAPCYLHSVCSRILESEQQICAACESALRLTPTEWPHTLRTFGARPLMNQRVKLLRGCYGDWLTCERGVHVLPSGLHAGLIVRRFRRGYFAE